MDKPTVDVVILNYNTRDILAQCIPNVLKYSQGEHVRIVLADNCSTDGSMEFARKTFGEQLDYIEIPENLGFAGGYNYALAQRSSDYFLLLNSDAEPAHNEWLDELIEASQQPHFAAAQPKILDYNQRNQFEYAGANGGFMDPYGFPFCRGRIFGNVETDTQQYDEPIEIFWASGAALFVKREAWENAGGLDDRFFAHMEEIDLCWRLKNLGYKIYSVPSSRVFHMGGATLSNQSPRKTFLNFRNGLLMMHKNLEEDKRDRIIFQRKLFDGLAGVFFLIQGKFKHTVEIIKAHRAFDKIKIEFHSDTPKKDIKSHAGVITDSLVLGYFFKGKRTWNRWFR